MALLLKWLFPIWLAFTPVHDYYVTLFEMDYNSTEKRLEITTKAFLDDIEKALGPEYHQKLGTDEETPEVKAALKQYYLKQLTILLNDQPAKIQFLGHELQDDLIWMYAEIEDVDRLEKVEVNCRFLLSVYPEQINIINLKANGDTKTSLLQRENSIARWEFDAK